MADFGAVRAGIATRLATISGLQAYTTVPGQIATPAAFVSGPTSAKPLTMGSSKRDWRVRVRILVTRAVEAAGQDALDDFLSVGTTSIDDAIAGDPTLGGSADVCHVEDSCVGYGQYDHAGILYWGFEAQLRIVA